MFYKVTGTLIHTEPGVAVVDVGGVAFKCAVSMQTLRGLPRQGEKAALFTHLHVREDALELFGFLTLAEQGCFKTLTAISGVGPKVGLSILSELTPEQVALAAASGDAKQFARANGVGPKLAQRIVLELKDKVKNLSGGEGLSGVVVGGPSASGNASQAVGALVTLGYSPSEAAAAVSKLDSALPPEELIRLALKGFGA